MSVKLDVIAKVVEQTEKARRMASRLRNPSPLNAPVRFRPVSSVAFQGWPFRQVCSWREAWR